MPKPDHWVSARVWCDRGDMHELCVQVNRQVPPDLRCTPSGSAGINGGGSACHLPQDLQSRVEYELRENLQESLRRGWVKIAA